MNRNGKTLNDGKSTANLLGQFHHYTLRLQISWLLECKILRDKRGIGSACAVIEELQKRTRMNFGHASNG